MKKNEKVLYVGRLPFGRVEKICANKDEANRHHQELVDSGLNVTLHGIFPADQAGVTIDRLMHVDVSNQLPN